MNVNICFSLTRHFVQTLFRTMSIVLVKYYRDQPKMKQTWHTENACELFWKRLIEKRKSFDLKFLKTANGLCRHGVKYGTAVTNGFRWHIVKRKQIICVTVNCTGTSYPIDVIEHLYTVHSFVPHLFRRNDDSNLCLFG